MRISPPNTLPVQSAGTWQTPEECSDIHIKARRLRSVNSCDLQRGRTQFCHQNRLRQRPRAAPAPTARLYSVLRKLTVLTKGRRGQGVWKGPSRGPQHFRGVTGMIIHREPDLRGPVRASLHQTRATSQSRARAAHRWVPETWPRKGGHRQSAGLWLCGRAGIGRERLPAAPGTSLHHQNSSALLKHGLGWSWSVCLCPQHCTRGRALTADLITPELVSF